MKHGREGRSFARRAAAVAAVAAIAVGCGKAMADTPTLDQMDKYVAKRTTEDMQILKNSMANPHVVWVAPDGKPTNTGAKDSPIDLKTAYTNRGLVTPGTIVWIGAGRYDVGILKPGIAGQRERPIILRAVPGARATINGSIQTARGHDHIWWWGVEVTGPEGSGVDTGGGGDDLKFINLFIHDKYPLTFPTGPGEHPTDMGVGGWDDNNDCEFYGDIVFGCGWTQLDHGFYTQNTKAHNAKRYVDTIVFENAGECFQIYGSAPVLRNIYFEGNACFCTSVMKRLPKLAPQMNVLLGGNGAHPLSCVVVRNNCTYHSELNSKRGVDIGYGNKPNSGILIENNYFTCGANAMELKGVGDDVTVRNNTFWSAKGLVLVTYATPAAVGKAVFENNTYIDNGHFKLADLQATTHSGQTDKVVAGKDGRPADVHLFVRVNRYEPDRVHLVVYNWPKTPTVALDLSDVLKTGQKFRIVEVHDLWAKPILEGAYDGKPVQMQMVGNYAPEFGCYILFRE